ncbi:NADH-quinone oxidoreductase subunit C [Rhodococcus sp. AW25M09]|uniref:NADH-quinone oxidoreductase subunit C n=1 Tax=Rhodococcus sp. AW25M09 TaxID=1268303 RepID=UPI0002AD07CB|nr:NADH-quinone oxidoreductase subunit C [Rhodococcus sp. AW25M09]CCQ16793.1 NADH-quinone oxidoreductase subunit C [Rhodococcus sp. AW25M09]
MTTRGPGGMFGVRGTGDTSGYGRLQPPVAPMDTAARPYGGYFDALVDRLATVLESGDTAVPFEDAVERVVIHRGELTLHLERQYVPTVARVLRDDEELRFELCTGASGVHYPDQVGRELRAVYHLVSITHGRRVRLEVAVPDADPHTPSLCGVYPTNDWHEREVYDFFGLVFDGHPALTRIEMPDDWVGHPQRKDYPLGGIPIEYKGARVAPPNERRSYN